MMKKLIFYFLLFCSAAAVGQSKMPLKQSPVAFTPVALTPLFFHESLAANMASDGSSWTDTMGNYNITGTGTAKPTYNATAVNGKPGFVFDGVNDVMVGARVTQWQNINKFTLAMVGKRSVTIHDNGAFTNFTTLVHYSDDNLYPQLYTGVANYGLLASTNVFHSLIMIYDGTQSTNATKLILYVNGVQQTLTFTGTIPTTTENNASSVLAIGRYVSVFLAGTHVEDFLVTRVITAGEITSVNTYFTSKFGL